ncbi:ureidoglycolate lyase [Mesorhizobium sp. SP-1A]|uniref:ureidoglycolate lyase n=1 Tax=Mesorhizobium sp. SP-1A TaxID=3077840 RepID=UPI0028F71145|nr:ureidoglycolate lyase [Mesorhizobium sp. SP-1A]
MQIEAVNVLEGDFAPYGRVYDMKSAEPSKDPATRTIHSQGSGWEDTYTANPLIGSNGSLGFTLGSACPFHSAKMERHLLTEEALFCAADPIVLAVAAPTAEDFPSAENIRAFVIEPSTVVVLNKGTWHDACHGVDREARYYWMATCGLGASPWVEVEGGPVLVTAPERAHG